MIQTKLFRSNRSQAVRLSKAVALPDSVKDVDIVAIGNRRIITPCGSAWDSWFDEGDVSDDFLANRNQCDVQERDSFDD